MNYKLKLISTVLLILPAMWLFSQQDDTFPEPFIPEPHMQQATFGGGCFWCVEAIFQRLNGVEYVMSGYAGGDTKRPTYRQVISGNTGHAEVVQVTFDPEIISFRQLMEVFFRTHNPTTLNRQGNDIGTQYRSIVLYNSDEQRESATEVISMLEQAQIWPDPIVTQVEPLDTFYPAEDYHQNYFNKNPEQAYCQVVILPKVMEFKELFRDKLAN
jgi:peptide-methionine (S)-S-oxide reductase